MTDEQLREIYARATARRTPAVSREGCVSPEDILGLVRREGSEERRLEVLDHVMQCDACRQDMHLLQSIEAAGASLEAADAPRYAGSPQQSAAGGAGAKVIRLAARRRWPSFVPAALAASVVLVIGIGLARQFLTTPDDTMRDAGNGVALVAPPAEVPAGQPLTFTWRPVPSAERYELEILTADGAMVFAGVTRDTTLGTGQLRLSPGTDYRWWVRAVTPGAQINSAVRPLRLQPR